MCFLRHPYAHNVSLWTLLLLPSIFLEFPVSIVQRAHLTCLEPSRDAVEVKSMLPDGQCRPAICERHVHTLQMPQATVHSSLVAEAWLA